MTTKPIIFQWRSKKGPETVRGPITVAPCLFCSNPCVLTHPVCKQHALTKFGVRVDASLLHGFGLFAARSFKAGDIICPYGGAARTRKYLESLYGPDATAPYAVTMSNGKIKDAAFVRGVGSNTNDGGKNDSNAQYVEKDMARQKVRDDIWIQAARPIRVGEEILVPYGRSYRHRDHECCTK